MSTSDQEPIGSSVPFDAYYELLGIPASEQPPSYYRLLGLSPLESNSKVIERAVDRQMSHLRSFKTGEAALASQRLLSEIAKASRVLLAPSTKVEYDNSLRLAAPVPATAVLQPAVMTFPTPPIGQSMHMVQQIPVGRAVPQTFVSNASLPSAPSSLVRTEPDLDDSSAGSLPLIAGGVAGCALVLLIVAIIASSRPKHSTLAEKASTRTQQARNDSNPQPSFHPPSAPAPTALTPAAPATPAMSKPVEIAVASDSRTIAPIRPEVAEEQKSPAVQGSTPSPPPVAEKEADLARTTVANDNRGSHPGKLPPGEWVDLFPRIRVEDDALSGNWRFEENQLSAAGSGMAKLRLPVDLRDSSYDLQVEFISDRDPENVNVILPVGERSVLLVGDGYINVGTLSYFSLIRGKEPIHYPDSVRGSMLSAGVRYKYDISVQLHNRDAKLNLALNGEPKFSYLGPIKDLQVVPAYRLPDNGWPGLASWFSPITFLSCKVRLHEGPGETTRDAPSNGDHR